MTESTAVLEPTASRDEFAAMLDSSLGEASRIEGSVVRGRIIAIDGEEAIVDVGLKSEGRVPLREFAGPGQSPEVKVGDTVDIYVERFENKNGEAVLSRDKARREESWNRLERAFVEQTKVEGHIFGRVKGGFAVDLGGAVAFLPGSQVDIRPIREVGHLLNKPEPFLILKMDRRRGNIVVSRRAVLEESRAEQRNELLANLREGQIIDGVVTNITDYGAFVELEPGVEGLVHVSEMSWTKKNVHPGKIVSTSQEVEVMVLEVDPEKRRISLGLKQCQQNPWERFAETHPPGTQVEGELKNITEFGLFIGLEGDIDGMVHLSDISWDVEGEKAAEGFKKGDMVKAVVLDVDVEKERISLGIKQLSGDPFKEATAGLKKGDRVTCTVKEVTPGGIEVETTTGAPGFIRKAELSRDRGDQRPDRFAVGEKLDAKVTGIDQISRKLTLSVKALEIEDEKQAMAEYGSSDSGASLGDILGAALRRKKDDDKVEDAAD